MKFPPKYTKEFPDDLLQWAHSYSSEYGEFKQLSDHLGVYVTKVGNEEFATKVVYQDSDGIFRIVNKYSFSVLDMGIYLPTDYNFRLFYGRVPEFNPETGERFEYFSGSNQWYQEDNTVQKIAESWDELGIDPAKFNHDPKKLKKECRKVAFKHHPDRGGDPEKSKRVNAAWGFLVSEGKVATN